jgi:curved DNA-binding protein CbpA
VQVKDYYSILELPSSASVDEIKKAYRRLAHLHHPDKNDSDAYSSTQFSDIKEAYEVLINPAKKDVYLQQRWYMQSIGKKLKHESVTPVTILKQMLELNRYVSNLDIHRMYHEGLFNHINTILSDENITMLNSFNDPAVNKEIILSTLKSGNALSYRFINPLIQLLDKISITDSGVIEKKTQFTRHHRLANEWEKRKVWVILLIALLICLGIFFTTK